MSDKLTEQVQLAIDQLKQNLQAHRDLIDKADSDRAPEIPEQSALAYMLQGFYTWVENVFKRIAQEVDGGIPDSESWHRDLLRSMRAGTTARPAVISEELFVLLRDYLSFRHFSRAATAVMLDWAQMRPLVVACDGTLSRFEREIGDFLKALGRDPGKTTP